MTETQTPERLADSPLLFIASDIDATFIDHATYSYEAAKPTFDRALESGAAIHFISSKTLAEMIPLQQELGILGKQSLSGENGSVSLIPVDYYDEKVAEELPGVLNIREYSIGNNTFMAIEYARPISQALAALDETTYEAGLHEEQVETITRMSPERFSELTGLTVEEAKRGQIREYQEGFLLHVGETERAEALAQVRKGIESKGFNFGAGGRFFSISGGGEKGKAVSNVIKFYERRHSSGIYSVGLGDGLSDISFLSVCDRGVLVRNPKKSVNFDVPEGIETIDEVGPEGWAKIVSEILDSRSHP